MLYVCKVEGACRGADWSLKLGPGSFHDLDAEVAPGLRLRDVVEESWFEPFEPKDTHTHDQAGDELPAEE